MLVVKGLRRAYGVVQAVDDVSFTLPPGGSLGIVGEPGSGKTATALIVVGLERADEGEVHVLGRSPPAAPALITTTRREPWTRPSRCHSLHIPRHEGVPRSGACPCPDGPPPP
ncbi:ATP-binding cassette domain-containing protein [Streptomyces sp. NPDC046371]|uniref:ATP-binding cassette domain-containing protein n=1 Tax=unclassified Streptomyces TaxID=2593676 RepID=UPI0033EA5952